MRPGLGRRSASSRLPPVPAPPLRSPQPVPEPLGGVPWLSETWEGPQSTGTPGWRLSQPSSLGKTWDRWGLWPLSL